MTTMEKFATEVKAAAKVAAKSAVKQKTETVANAIEIAKAGEVDGVDADVNVLRASLLFRNMNQCIADIFETQTGGAVTVTQYEIFRAIHGMDGLSQTDVAAATGMDRSTVAELTKRLSARGYIERKRLPHDERTFVLSLTPRGLEALRLGSGAYTKVMKAVTSTNQHVVGLEWVNTFVQKYTKKLDKRRSQVE